MSSIFKQSAKGQLSPKQSIDSASEIFQLRSKDRKLTYQFPEQKPEIKPRVSISIANLNNNKNKGRIECEDFWSSRMKAQLMLHKRTQKTEIVQKEESPIPKPREPENIDILTMKSKMNRSSPYYITVGSPRSCKASVNEIENIIEECLEARKQVKRLNHKIDSDKGQLERNFKFSARF